MLPKELPLVAYHHPPLSLEDTIHRIAWMPDIVVRAHGIEWQEAEPPYFEMDEDYPDRKFIQSARQLYWMIAEWLIYELDVINLEIASDAVDDELHEKIRPEAQKALANYQLAKNICFFHKQKTGKWNDPCFWWYKIEFQHCDEMLWHQGYFSNPANPLGASDFYKQTVKFSRAWKNPTELTEMTIPEILALPPFEAMLTFGWLIQEQDKNWKEFNRYWKTVSRADRELERSTLKPMYIIRGEQRTYGRGQGSGRRKKK